MATKKKPRGLGRGLDELLGIDTSGDGNEAATSGEFRLVPANQLQPGRYQPRTGMDPERLTELAESIKAQGVIQPIVVRGIGVHRYEIIAGERRWRAAQQAGLIEVPVVVREVPDQAAIAMALIENIQREDLNPLEEAAALSRLIREFDLTHQQAADAVGRSRAAVSNLLRLLDLPEAVRTLAAADGGWSVRELEERVRNEQLAKTGGKNDGKKKPGTDPNITRLEQDLSEKLATRVAIQHARNGRGKLVIVYHSLDELDGILERIR